MKINIENLYHINIFFINKWRLPVFKGYHHSLGELKNCKIEDIIKKFIVNFEKWNKWAVTSTCHAYKLISLKCLRFLFFVCCILRAAKKIFTGLKKINSNIDLAVTTALLSYLSSWQFYFPVSQCLMMATDQN